MTVAPACWGGLRARAPSTSWGRSRRGSRRWSPRRAGIGRRAGLDRGRPDQLVPVGARISTAVAPTSWGRSPCGPRPRSPRRPSAGRGAGLDRGRRAVLDGGRRRPAGAGRGAVLDQLVPVEARISTAVAARSSTVVASTSWGRSARGPRPRSPRGPRRWSPRRAGIGRRAVLDGGRRRCAGAAGRGAVLDQLVPVGARISTAVAPTSWCRSPCGPRRWSPRPAGADRGAGLDRGRLDVLGPVGARSSTAVAADQLVPVEVRASTAVAPASWGRSRRGSRSWSTSTCRGAGSIVSAKDEAPRPVGFTRLRYPVRRGYR